jgi:hypothetical protein
MRHRLVRPGEQTGGLCEQEPLAVVWDRNIKDMLLPLGMASHFWLQTTTVLQDRTTPPE